MQPDFELGEAADLERVFPTTDGGVAAGSSSELDEETSRTGRRIQAALDIAAAATHREFDQGFPPATWVYGYRWAGADGPVIRPLAAVPRFSGNLAGATREPAGSYGGASPDPTMLLRAVFRNDVHVLARDACFYREAWDAVMNEPLVHASAEFYTELDEYKNERGLEFVVELVRELNAVETNTSCRAFSLTRLSGYFLGFDALTTGANQMIWRFGYMTTVD